MPDETAVETFGAVQIRHMPGACLVGTCVHGEPAQTCDTGLRRLIGYLNGDNHHGAMLRAERPVIQQQLGPLLWRISLRLPTVPNGVAPPAPRAPKVKLWSTQPGWLAVVRMSGRPGYSAVASGDAMVLNAIVNTEWVATGGPMIRRHASGPSQWFTSGFEVAVPVAPRCHGDAQQSADSSFMERLPAG